MKGDPVLALYRLRGIEIAKLGKRIAEQRKAIGLLKANLDKAYQAVTVGPSYAGLILQAKDQIEKLIASNNTYKVENVKLAKANERLTARNKRLKARLK